MATGTDDAFASASLRHLDGAERMLGDPALPDECAYLAGYVVECALKAVAECSGLAGKDFAHSLRALTGPVLVRAYALWPCSRRYALPVDPELDRVRDGWTPEMRYSRTGSVSTSEAGVWLSGATGIVESVLIPAILDGVVTMR